jgi:hypothetical protein
MFSESNTGGGTPANLMVVSDSEETQVADAEVQDGEQTQENQGRPSHGGGFARAQGSAHDMQGGDSNNQPTSAPDNASGGNIAVITSSAPGTTNASNSIAASTSNQAGPKNVPKVPAGPAHQRTRHPGETFTLHPTDPEKLIARIRIEYPNAPGTYYEQIDEIDELDGTATSPPDPKFYFLPNLEVSKIPPRDRANKKNNHQPAVWTRQPNSMVWSRPSRGGGPLEYWRPNIVFRRFNFTTRKYEDIHISIKKLENIDPNEQEYHHAYNKWLDQIKRRKDSQYKKSVSKDHWSIAERRALFRAVNDFVRRRGLPQFGFNGVQMSQKDMQVMADTVNAVGGMNRRADAVRGQLSSSYPKKNKAVYELLKRADDMRDRIDGGESFTRNERYLVEAIPQDQFPQDTDTKKRKGRSTKERKDKSRKKRAFAAIMDTDAELSDPPSNLDSPVRQPRIHTYRAPSPLSDFERTSIRPNKKPRHEDLAGNELYSGDENWAETDEEMLSDGAQEDQDSETYSDNEIAIQKNLAAKEVVDVNQAIENSFRRGPLTTGVIVPGEVESDSDSDSLLAPASTRKAIVGRRQGTASARPAALSPNKKRKRTPTPETEQVEGSDGDDEAETASSEGSSIKKTRRGGHK